MASEIEDTVRRLMAAEAAARRTLEEVRKASEARRQRTISVGEFERRIAALVPTPKVHHRAGFCEECSLESARPVYHTE